LLRTLITCNKSCLTGSKHLNSGGLSSRHQYIQDSYPQPERKMYLTYTNTCTLFQDGVYSYCMRSYVMSALIFIMISLPSMMIFGMPNMVMDDASSVCPLFQLMQGGCALDANPAAMTAHHISFIGQLTTTALPSKIMLVLFFIAVIFVLLKSRKKTGGNERALNHAHRARSQIACYRVKRILLRWLALKNKQDDCSPYVRARAYSYS